MYEWIMEIRWITEFDIINQIFDIVFNQYFLKFVEEYWDNS
jgi:hypothetical protein